MRDLGTKLEEKPVQSKVDVQTGRTRRGKREQIQNYQLKSRAFGRSQPDVKRGHRTMTFIGLAGG
ncbi:hypothetical protein K503DRAFT_776070, partial [Rhizopogon vinicolor AM-OR11-026]